MPPCPQAELSRPCFASPPAPWLSWRRPPTPPLLHQPASGDGCSTRRSLRRSTRRCSSLRPRPRWSRPLSRTAWPGPMPLPGYRPVVRGSCPKAATSSSCPSTTASPSTPTRRAIFAGTRRSRARSRRAPSALETSLTAVLTANWPSAAPSTRRSSRWAPLCRTAARCSTSGAAAASRRGASRPVGPAPRASWASTSLHTSWPWGGGSPSWRARATAFASGVG